MQPHASVLGKHFVSLFRCKTNDGTHSLEKWWNLLWKLLDNVGGDATFQDAQRRSEVFNSSWKGLVTKQKRQFQEDQCPNLVCSSENCTIDEQNSREWADIKKYAGESPDVTVLEY